MAVSIGTIATKAESGNGTTIDVTGVNLNGFNAILVCVGFDDEELETVTSVVIDPGGADETTLDALGSATRLNNARVDLRGKAGLSLSGTNYTVRVTLSASVIAPFIPKHAVVYPLSGVHAATPFGTFASSDSGGGGNPTLTVTSAAGELVVAAMVGELVGLSTVASPATEDYDEGAGVSTMATAHQDGASPNVSFSWTTTLNDHWVTGGVSIKAAAGAPPDRPLAADRPLAPDRPLALERPLG